MTDFERFQQFFVSMGVTYDVVDEPPPEWDQHRGHERYLTTMHMFFFDDAGRFIMACNDDCGEEMARKSAPEEAAVCAVMKHNF